MKRYLTFILSVLLLGVLTAQAQAYYQQGNIPNPTYKELYRPQYHFSPSVGWIGDPCGLTYYQGKFHLFWWGKAESEALVHYNEINRRAMQGGPKGISYFPGSVLIDKKGTAGFGENAWVAAYTISSRNPEKQSQGLSFSHDGRTFNWYDQNPVLDEWSNEFRDPTVFWHEETGQRDMVVARALARKVGIYTSPDLKKWTWASDFGPAGDSEKAWECPDLIQIPVEGTTQKKWVMILSINWAQEQYFVGDFDGKTFTIGEGQPKTPQYIDKGYDFYASRVFRDYDGTLKDVISIGWVSAWDYARNIPNRPGQGLWSIPRVLKLKETAVGYIMTQPPYEGLKSLRGDKVSYSQEIPVGIRDMKFKPATNVYEMEVTIDATKPNDVGFNLMAGNGHKLAVQYDTESQYITVDLTYTGDVTLEKFPRVAYAKVPPVDGKLRLRFFVDKSSVELFANEGEDVFTFLAFPAEDQTGLESFALKKGTKMTVEAWPLASIWN